VYNVYTRKQRTCITFTLENNVVLYKITITMTYIIINSIYI